MATNDDDDRGVDALIRQAREDHRTYRNAERARALLYEAMTRTLERRVDDAIVDALFHIEAEARRERNETVIDFVREDVRDGVWEELNLRGFKCSESKFRACASTDAGSDAVASLVVRW